VLVRTLTATDVALLEMGAHVMLHTAEMRACLPFTVPVLPLLRHTLDVSIAFSEALRKRGGASDLWMLGRNQTFIDRLTADIEALERT